jgi:FkbM family methyltransferase
MKKTGIALHWDRLKRSWGRRFHEFRLPSGYKRFGTRYGGWWVNTKLITRNPLLIDCGLGEDISFPIEFIQQFPDAHVIGVEPNPRSLSYCYKNLPKKMKIIEKAFWKNSDEKLSFYLPRSQDQLPKGADGVSGSVLDSHEYVDGGELLEVLTIDLESILSEAGHSNCNILKLDIEGAEYEVLDALAKGCMLSKIKQLLVEFHHGVTDHTMVDTENSIGKIISCGFDLVHVEGRDHVFERRV